jgi:hypothetical protein
VDSPRRLRDFEKFIDHIAGAIRQMHQDWSTKVTTSNRGQQEKDDGNGAPTRNPDGGYKEPSGVLNVESGKTYEKINAVRRCAHAPDQQTSDAVVVIS